jgi:hypothetical protein
MRRWRDPGRGSAPASRRYTIGFDDDTLSQVRALAAAERVSFAEKIRQLVEFGLETVENERQGRLAIARSEKR